MNPRSGAAVSIAMKEDLATREEREAEDREWIDSLEYVISTSGPERAGQLLRKLQIYSQKKGVDIPYTANTPYVNTIAAKDQPLYPGNYEIERTIRSVIRWNAMAMVVRANMLHDGIGGHISTYASAATLYEIGFNHFFRAGDESWEGDMIYFQGHASPGIYARAFLEGAISIEQVRNFRREVEGKGVSSYPHPWLMPGFWQFPTVSMGLCPIMAIYQARFNRYLEDRGLKPRTDAKVWAFIGDGETDEPETLGAITLASREELDNLVFVINCNLQRLDGPVRGNGKIIQELERIFRGAGWNVIKVLWGSNWDPLLESDRDGLLVERMEKAVDGDYQKYIVSSGKYIREHFFGTHPELLRMVEKLSDVQLEKLARGGHDSEKVYAAYKAAVENRGSPTVILAKTIKGYGLGEAGEGRNITHQQKKLNEQELRDFRARFYIPLSEEDVTKAPFYRLPEDGPEMKYLRERREELGGTIPNRRVRAEPLEKIPEKVFEEFMKPTGPERKVATTMVIVHMLSRLLRDKDIGKLVVPIVPDEARTFGMESLFRQVGIYSHAGQIYEPVDADTFLYYKEAKDGQILEEGITEAGSMSSFIAAGTAYSTHGINTIPFFIYYSMFGFQRIGDLIWAAADMKCRGFLVGGTAGRTTLAGEGLQHQDGNSHHFAYAYPNLKAYDPAFSYEIAVIVRDGIKRMYGDGEDIFYYITVMNERYEQPAPPEGAEEGIIRGMYRFSASETDGDGKKAHLFGSGAIMNEVLRARDVLEGDYGVSTDVWSVTSYKELYRDARETERWNRLNPGAKKRKSHVSRCMEGTRGVFVAASDYLKSLPDSVSGCFPRPLVSLGTDGFGRSDTRESLRDFFEVDHRHIALAALYELHREDKIGEKVVKDAVKKLKINPDAPSPASS